MKKDSSVPFLHHNPSKLNHKRPDSDHPKAQGLAKRPQSIFVSGRISELTSATSLSVNDKKKNNIISFGGFIDVVRSLSANIGRIVTDVTTVSNLAQSFLSTYRLILEGVPVTNGPNYR